MKSVPSEQGMCVARERIALEAKARTGYLDLGRLGLTTLPDELFDLRHLRNLNLGYGFEGHDGGLIEAVSGIANHDFGEGLACLSLLPELQYLVLSGTALCDLSPLSGLTALQGLDCFDTLIVDLSPLSGLTALQRLDCGSTSVADLSPLSGLTALQTLYCFDTSVVDLSPLSGLAMLQTLHCYGTSVAELSPLSGLTALQTLECSGTQVVELSPLSGLTALQTLDCSRTSVADLSPLSGLTALQTLDCANTLVADLSPLSGLTALQTLHCSGTSVADLSPLSGLTALQMLDCSSTSVADLSPLSGLTTLQTLDCDHCELKQIPEGFWDKPSLQELSFYQAQLPGIPAEVLSQNYFDNCLEQLRAHLHDLEAGIATISDVKLMVLGNGRVGKTQICRRLRGEDYDESVDSNHGIIVSSSPLKQADGALLARLQFWDFGGQDIYHGTHALFLKTRAVFLTVWATESENTENHQHGGMLFRNRPLGYWLSYVRHLGGPNSPVLAVQTRCDRPEDEARRLPIDEDALNGFPFFKFLHYSALKDRGRAALDEALREAVLWLREQQGTSFIGAGRLRVQRRLEALREADFSVPPEQRQYRTLSQEHFQSLCAEAGGVSSPEHCLDYLHHAGVVFYRPGLFGDCIVLDQGWALEGIYTVFHREKCYQELKRLGGRFSRSLLEMLVWQDYSESEQRLFLDMMQSCGICFVYKEGDQHLGIEAEYMAPELLPSKAELAAELAEKWTAAEPFEEAIYRYQLHQPGLLRSLMAEIGQSAGVNGLYWQDGVCVFESTTRSHALIEQEGEGDWSGLIRVRTQGGRAMELLARFRELVIKHNHHWGLQPMETPELRAVAQEKIETPAPDFEFAQQPKSGLEYCVSYAWGDDSPEGKERGLVVDRLCQLATDKGIRILRDKQDLRLGDQLSKFMRRIGQGDRVFVIISDKYLKSPNCMYELFEIWRNSHQETDEFLQRVRIYSTSCARIFSVGDRLNYAVHWKNEHDAIKAAINEHGAEVLGVEDFKAFKRMDEFAGRVGDILAAVADVIHARKFEDLEQYGFNDSCRVDSP
ncbi:MAG: leucine-rich repeat domain-containing protein [Methylobacter sp.]